MAFISVLAGTFNEEDNVRELYDRITQIFREQLPEYSYELMFIDNASTDNTVSLLKKIAALDKRVKIILNTKKFRAYPIRLLRIATSKGRCRYCHGIRPPRPS